MGHFQDSSCSFSNRSWCAYLHAIAFVVVIGRVRRSSNMMKIGPCRSFLVLRARNIPLAYLFRPKTYLFQKRESWTRIPLGLRPCQDDCHLMVLQMTSICISMVDCRFELFQKTSKTRGKSKRATACFLLSPALVTLGILIVGKRNKLRKNHSQLLHNLIDQP